MYALIGPPKQPANLTVVDVGDSTISLQWIPGFHGGFPQTFYVEYQVATQDKWQEVIASNQVSQF